jgi:hypothetical protein
MQRAAFEKNQSPDAGTIVYGKALHIKDKPGEFLTIFCLRIEYLELPVQSHFQVSYSSIPTSSLCRTGAGSSRRKPAPGKLSRV